jgi:uncharacterized protein (DUF1697 family)
MKYCAFLRGVNVKGTNMKMAEVCQVFKDAGMKDVASILASGNIVFSSDKKAGELKKFLKKQCLNISLMKLICSLNLRKK